MFQIISKITKNTIKSIFLKRILNSNVTFFTKEKLTLKNILFKKIKNLNSYLFKENEKKIKNPVQNSGPWGPNSDWDTKKNYIL